MNNRSYLLRAGAVALLLWGSIVLVLLAGKRPHAGTGTPLKAESAASARAE